MRAAAAGHEPRSAVSGGFKAGQEPRPVVAAAVVGRRPERRQVTFVFSSMRACLVEVGCGAKSVASAR